MLDGNIVALDRYLREQEAADIMTERFRADIQLYIDDMIQAMESIQGYIRQYDYEYGWDMESEAIETIKEELGIR